MFARHLKAHLLSCIVEYLYIKIGQSLTSRCLLQVARMDFEQADGQLRMAHAGLWTRSAQCDAN